MQSDAKVPDPAPRGISMPAGAVVVLVLTGAIWGVGLFLLGRQTAPPVEVLDRAAAGHLASLNRIDQAFVTGDPDQILTQLGSATLPDDPLGRTALELRRARLTELVMAHKARAAEEAAKRAAQEAAEAAKRAEAAPEAVLKRLRNNLWRFFGGAERVDKPAPTGDQRAIDAVQPTPVAPPEPVLAELTLAGERFVPVAQIRHPLITHRAYALHPTKGLLRSDDSGTMWRAGLQPLQDLAGYQLAFTSGDERPLLIILDRKGHSWLFNDAEDAFFP